jgi:hypothetical protein
MTTYRRGGTVHHATRATRVAPRPAGDASGEQPVLAAACTGPPCSALCRLGSPSPPGPVKHQRPPSRAGDRSPRRSCGRQSATRRTQFSSPSAAWGQATTPASRPSAPASPAHELNWLALPTLFLASALRPGGMITVTTWAAGAMQPVVGILWRARLDCGLAPPFAAAVAAAEEPGRLLGLAAGAGLDPARVDVRHQKLALPGPTGWALGRGAVLNSVLADLAPGQGDRVRRRLDEAMARNGNLADATALILHARQPARPRRPAPTPGRTP